MKYNIILILSVFFIGIANYSFLHRPQEGLLVISALPKIQKEAKVDYKRLLKATSNFKNAINNKKDYKNAYLDVREQLNTIEFLLSYLDKEWYEQKINAAPLPKLEKKVADIHVLNPRGIQVVDELINEEFTTENQLELLRLVTDWEHDLMRYEEEFENLKLSERQIFEALRYQIIRLGTLSITGFDTPGSLNAIEDARTEMKSVHKYLKFFKNELYRVSKTEFLTKAEFLFEIQLYKTNNANFESLDRYNFLQNYINPMYSLIYEIHIALAYETWVETDNYTHKINYEAQNLFAKDFLNPFGYTSLPNDSLLNKKRALGKLLFYDPILSANASMSCASCHDPALAFTDGKPKSINFTKDGTLDRNAMMLPYSIYSEKLFWDLRVNGLEKQFQHVITNDQEFHSSYAEATARLEESKEYKKLFAEAFPSYKEKISAPSLDYALTAYVMNLGTFDSRFDESMQDSNKKLTKEEIDGFNLFSGKAACATCHFFPTFSGLVPPSFIESESEVLGITKSTTAPWLLDEDAGRAQGLFSEFIDFYQHSFKTVSLRNIEKTAPYMHNGAFETLEEVMRFYNEGGGLGRGLDVPHQTLAGDSLNLTDTEQKAIIAFMKTLTDQTEFKEVLAHELPRDFKDSIWNNR